MIHLPDCSVTDTHARGLRRAEDRRVGVRQTTWKSPRNPRRFGPRVRQTHADLIAVHGPGRVICAESTKRSALWFVVNGGGDSFYRLESIMMEREYHRAARSKARLPWVATAHCYERFIQGLLRHDLEWARIMYEAFTSLMSTTDFESDPPTTDPRDTYRWQKPGAYKVWLEHGLAVVEVPETGDAIMLTLIASGALIGPNRELWEYLGNSDFKARRFTRRPVSDWFEEPAEGLLEEAEFLWTST